MRKTLIMTALLGMVINGGLAAAQSEADGSDAITRCAAQPDAQQRIACLEAALRGETITSAPATEIAEVEAPTPADQTVQAETAAPVVAPVPAPVTKSAAAPVLGAEQVAARTASRQTAPKPESDKQVFTVRSTRTVPYEKLEVSLANGQVWRQIKGDSQKIRIPRKYRDSLNVEIWSAPVSGYKMRLTELNRTIRVERLR